MAQTLDEILKRAAETRVPRRSFLAAAGLLGGSAVLAGCGGSTASSAPAAIAFGASSVKTITRTFLPEPFGSGVVPRTFCSPEVASTPRWNESSTVSSNFAFGNLLRISTASFSGYSWARSATFTALR